MSAATTVDRVRLRDLYDEYVWLLDEGDYDAWLDLFVDDCDYRVVARENHERGLPLATMRCESRAMLEDRIHDIRNTQFFAPRLMRRFTGAPRAVNDEVVASFLVVETVEGEPTRVHMAGQYRDLVVDTPAGLRFARKVAVYDSPLVPTSLILPV